MQPNTAHSPKPHFSFITLFPDAIRVWLTTSILGRAHEKGLFSFDCIQLRDHSQDKHRSVDDTPYGGGGGMVLRLEPLVSAVESLKKSENPPFVVSFSPAGKPLNVDLIESLSTDAHSHHFAFICGHYEGIDQRFIEGWVDLEVSLGDFVLTGGELPAVAMADALIRRLAGTLSSEAASREESFSLREATTQSRLLEYPHYTRPAEFRGMKVPDILLSGDHARIETWRRMQSLERTQTTRPDLLRHPNSHCTSAVS